MCGRLSCRARPPSLIGCGCEMDSIFPPPCSVSINFRRGNDRCPSLTCGIRLFISNGQQFCSFECTRGRVHASVCTNITLPSFFFPPYPSLPTAITLPASLHHRGHTCSFQRPSALASRPAKWCHQSLLRPRFPGLIAQSSGTVGPGVQTFLHESAVGFLLIVQSASTCPWRSFSTLQMKVG